MAKKPASVKRQKMIADIAVHTFLVIIAIIWLIPFVWIIAHSFRGESTGMYCATFFPKEFTFDNYIGLFTDKATMNFPKMFMNTFFISIFSCLVSSFFVLAVSYGLSRVKWTMRKPYMIFVMTPTLITAFTGNINNFNIIYLLSGGGPTYIGDSAGQTDLLVTWLYKLTIDNQEYNLAAVIGILTFVVLATVALVTYRNSGSYKDEEGFK